MSTSPQLPLLEGDPFERADAARNRERILCSAARLFDERGIECVSMDDIADAAGVGKGTVFRRFGSRAALAQAVAGRSFFFPESFDAVLTPPANGEARATLDSTGDPAFCTIWTLCGVPAITVPSGIGPRGLCMCLQIVGANKKDDKLLAVAHRCEGRLPFKSLLGVKGEAR